MLVTKLVLVLRGRDAPPGEGAGALVQLAATLLASCPAGLQLARPEGRQVPGRPVTPTDLCSAPGVMLVTKLVLVLRGRDAPPGEGVGSLVQLAATLLASCPAGLQLVRPEGRQVPGRPVTPTDLYTWTYT